MLLENLQEANRSLGILSEALIEDTTGIHISFTSKVFLRSFSEIERLLYDAEEAGTIKVGSSKAEPDFVCMLRHFNTLRNKDDVALRARLGRSYSSWVACSNIVEHFGFVVITSYKEIVKDKVNFILLEGATKDFMVTTPALRVQDLKSIQELFIAFSSLLVIKSLRGVIFYSNDVLYKNYNSLYKEVRENFSYFALASFFSKKFKDFVSKDSLKSLSFLGNFESDLEFALAGRDLVPLMLDFLSNISVTEDGIFDVRYPVKYIVSKNTANPSLEKLAKTYIDVVMSKLKTAMHGGYLALDIPFKSSELITSAGLLRYVDTLKEGIGMLRINKVNQIINDTKFFEEVAAHPLSTLSRVVNKKFVEGYQSIVPNLIGNNVDVVKARHLRHIEFKSLVKVFLDKVESPVEPDLTGLPDKIYSDPMSESFGTSQSFGTSSDILDIPVSSVNTLSRESNNISVNFNRNGVTHQQDMKFSDPVASDIMYQSMKGTLDAQQTEEAMTEARNNIYLVEGDGVLLEVIKSSEDDNVVYIVSTDKHGAVDTVRLAYKNPLYRDVVFNTIKDDLHMIEGANPFVYLNKDWYSESRISSLVDMIVKALPKNYNFITSYSVGIYTHIISIDLGIDGKKSYNFNSFNEKELVLSKLKLALPNAVFK